MSLHGPLSGLTTTRRFTLPPLPFVGRERERRALAAVLAGTQPNASGLAIVTGESGVGKSALAAQASRDAAALGWQVATGTAYEIESGYPYAIFADALTPLCAALDGSSMAAAMRGMEHELARIVPSLVAKRPTVPQRTVDTPLQPRWHVGEFLHRLASRRPLLLILENLHWVDAASLELLHHVVRHPGTGRIAILATKTDDGVAPTDALARFERSVARLPALTSLQVTPLTFADVELMVRRGFSARSRAVSPFCERLHAQSGGLPFFVEEILKSLVEQGTLRQAGDRWVGWDADVTTVTPAGRALVRTRLSSLSPDARRVANLLAVLGTRTTGPTLEHLATASVTSLANALLELTQRGVVTTDATASPITYDFTHPILQTVLYDELGSGVAPSYHAEVARALETLHGHDPERYASQLAPHLRYAFDRLPVEHSVRCLVEAGVSALRRRADGEADQLLSNALSLVERRGEPDPAQLLTIQRHLAQARRRLGQYDESAELLGRARNIAGVTGDVAAETALERQLGLAAFHTGHFLHATERFQRSESLALSVGDTSLAIRARLGRAMSLRSLGQGVPARALVLEVLPLAESLGDDALLARVHRAMVLSYSWTGPASAARAHGDNALACAARSGDHEVAWSVHWALAVMAGLSGDGNAVREHQRAAEEIAEMLSAPLLSAMSAEIGVEYASATGEWAEGLELAGRAVPIARALAPHTLLPRLLVWVGTMLIERDDMERALAHFREAFELSGAASGDNGRRDPHAVIPAHIGLATYHLRQNEFPEAIAYAERGLAIADTLDAAAWAIHRLLPILIEALIHCQEFERAEGYIARLRAQSRTMEHPLGLALADAADAILARYRDSHPQASTQMVQAADRMSQVPFLFPAARLRLNAAQLLTAKGLPAAAAIELRAAYDVFARMGAIRELRLTRERMQQLGIRPYKRRTTEAATLSEREEQIARMVAEGKTNKDIAAPLGIRARTVDAHLRSIFGKLGVERRGQIAGALREREETSPQAARP